MIRQANSAGVVGGPPELIQPRQSRQGEGPGPGRRDQQQRQADAPQPRRVGRLLQHAAIILGGLRRRWRLGLPFDRTAYPIYRRELLHWDARLGGQWRLSEGFALATLASLCLFPAALVIYPSLLLLYAALDEFLGLAISLPAATLIVREREARTWALLRSTPLSGIQIAVGKLSGLLYLAWEGAGYLVGARWVGSLLVVPLLALMLTLPRPFPLAADGWAGLEAAGLVAAYLAFVYRPRLNLAFGGALGLAAGSVARTAAGALVLTVLCGGAVTIVSAAAVWWFALTFDPGALFSESVLAGRLARIFIWLIPLALVTLARLGLTGLLLALAGHRAGALAE